MNTSLRSGIEHYIFLSVVTAIGSIGLFATDIYLTALPEMCKAFNCTQAEIQMSFCSFFLGLAFCQLIAGALSDHFGRKQILIIGIAIFTVASWLCATAETLPQFVAFRLLQAVGGGVGSVVFRALIVDRFDRLDAAKIFSVIFPIIGLSTAIAPFLGGYIASLWGWRGTFFFMAAFGVVILNIVIFFLGNLKNAVPRDVSMLRQAPVLRTKKYWDLLCNLEFLGYALVICTCFCAFRSYTVESPFVFHRQGYVAEEMGSFYVGLSITYLLGSLFARYLSRHSLQRALSVGIGALVVGGLAMLCAAFLFAHSPYAIILPMCMVAFGNGLLFPIGSAAALSAVPGELSGTAAGFMGCLQFLLAAFCISYVGDICQGQAMHMSLFITIIILLGIGSHLFLVYKSKNRTLIAEAEGLI